ncbi:T6SS immunity protein Tli3 family protein [Hafnia paralvei]|uniref:T6SS immunity protein Tli3 family protein n=1 Tax=Hafnia paralvei TaxID=546367 RepID=UPI003CF1B55C
MNTNIALIGGLLSTVFIAGCHAKKNEIPTQVIYRFDDHRYLELKGYNCEGALWYVDTQRGIKSEIMDKFYRAFGGKYIHPSERYIAITDWDISGFMVSKDYGQTWRNAHYASVAYGVEPDGTTSPKRENVVSFTVVNDQGFLLTKQGHLYLSSKPFDDPRVLPGGPGIDYTFTYDGKIGTGRIDPQFPGEKWGMSYIELSTLKGQTNEEKAEWQGLPTKVPEVKNYTGWDHMQCDPDLGLE